MIQNQFVGTWRLVSYELRGADGQLSYPYGPDTVGYLMYLPDGYMSVVIMSANRPKFAASDIMSGNIEERATAAKTYISYCGKYEIQGNKVIHHIEASLFPNWIAINQDRFFEFTAENLSLSTTPILVNGQQQTAHLIWERV